jgi:hypothetical protein
MIPKSGHRFRNRSCANKTLERADSKKRHPAPGAMPPPAAAGTASSTEIAPGVLPDLLASSRAVC